MSSQETTRNIFKEEQANEGARSTYSLEQVVDQNIKRTNDLIIALSSAQQGKDARSFLYSPPLSNVKNQKKFS